MITVRNCTTCAEEISQARREAAPNATLCLSCKEKQEANTPKVEVPVAYCTINKAGFIHLTDRSTQRDLQSGLFVPFQDEEGD
jgi:hypothetical protein